MRHAGAADVLSNILRQATAAIGTGFFQLQIDGGAPIYRERVYCYELYHQMRCLWPREYPYSLNGEVDKRAHPILSRIDSAVNTPDFLVHTPGDMAGNNTIIEVKHAVAQHTGLQKDLRTLDRFVRSYGYERAIYLIYGFEADDLLPEIQRNFTELACRSPIELWLHRDVGAPAVYIKTLQVG